MPNWCECDLMVEGLPERIREFLDAVRGGNGPFDFDRLIPYPENYKELDRLAAAWDTLPAEEKARTERPRDGYNSGGYEWCVSNWGTKWSACRELVGAVQEWGDSATVDISFSTAWSPPLPVIREASRRFPALRFDLRYFECGGQFNGMFLCQGGEVTADESGPYFGRRGG